MTRRNLVLLLALLVVLASGVTVWLALDRPEPADAARPAVRAGAYEPADLEGPAGPAVAAATATAPLALTFDHRDVRGSVRRAQAGMTPEFAERFRTTFVETTLASLEEQGAVTRGTVRAAGVVRVDGDDRVLALLYVEQELVEGASLGAGDRPRTLSRSRVLVDVVRRDGRWLVDGIRPF